MEGEDHQPPAPPPAADLQEALTAAVIQVQQRQDQLQEQLNNLLLRRKGQAPKRGNERPPFIVCRPVARNCFDVSVMLCFRMKRHCAFNE